MLVTVILRKVGREISLWSIVGEKIEIQSFHFANLSFLAEFITVNIHFAEVSMNFISL